MIKVKHFLDGVEADDGQRIWVEPVGVTRDLRDWCGIHHVMCHLAPPKTLWEWFEEHPEGYEYFRARYHDALQRGPYRPALQQLACAGMRENFTLVFQGEDPAHNSATALYEYLSELEAYCPPEL